MTKMWLLFWAANRRVLNVTNSAKAKAKVVAVAKKKAAATKKTAVAKKPVSRAGKKQGKGHPGKRPRGKK
jgi:hypothetical protein